MTVRAQPPWLIYYYLVTGTDENGRLNFLEHYHTEQNYSAMKPTVARHSDMPGREFFFFQILCVAIGTMLTSLNP